jgi:hypothetical protein
MRRGVSDELEHGKIKLIVGEISLSESYAKSGRCEMITSAFQRLTMC